MNRLVASSLSIVEVGPRDGLQAEAAILPTDVKLELVNRLVDSGLRSIEVTSFSHPERVPQLADADTVCHRLQKKAGVRYTGLVPNARGLDRAIAAGLNSIAVLSSASDAFSQANIGCDSDTALRNLATLCSTAGRQGIAVRAYVSCAFACPYEGPTDPEQVACLAATLIDLGCSEVALADTTGTSTPTMTVNLLQRVAEHLSWTHVAMHYHDTGGQALKNALTAYEIGVRTFDTAIGGLGGCPAAAGAGGNLATETLCEALQGLGIATGVDLDALHAARRYLWEHLHATAITKPTAGAARMRGLI